MCTSALASSNYACHTLYCEFVAGGRFRLGRRGLASPSQVNRSIGHAQYDIAHQARNRTQQPLCLQVLQSHTLGYPVGSQSYSCKRAELPAYCLGLRTARKRYRLGLCRCTTQHDHAGSSDEKGWLCNPFCWKGNCLVSETSHARHQLTI